MTHVTLKEVERLSYDILRRIGYSQELSKIIAHHLQLAERDGPASHGLAMLRTYKTVADLGKVNLSPEPTWEKPRPGTLIADCDNSFAQLGLQRARADFIDMVHAQGVAVLATINAQHIAALRHDVMPLAEAGLIAIMMSGSRLWVLPHEGERATFGTNPMAFACPRPDAPPIVWDQAASQRAVSDIRMAKEDGTLLETAGGLDTHGQPTADPAALLEAERLFGFGAHKGTSIALMIEIMAAGLTGGKFAVEHDPVTDGPINATGQAIIAIDPSAINPGFRDQLPTLLNVFEDNGQARIPGDGRIANAKCAAEDGVKLPDWLIGQLGEMGWQPDTGNPI